MRRKTIIFFPIEVGLAHIARSLAIAETLKKRGQNIIFALPKRKQDFFKASPVSFVDIVPTMQKDGIEFTSKIQDLPYLKKLAQSEIKIIERYKPDVIVIDARFSALISCLLKDIPTVWIANTDTLPFDVPLPNPGLPPAVFKITYPLFSLAARQFWNNYFQAIESATGHFGSRKGIRPFLKKMLCIVPEEPFYVPLKNNSAKICYVGPIFWQGFKKFQSPILQDIKSDGKTIYLTFGGTGFYSQKLLSLTNLLLANGYRVILTTGNLINEGIFKKNKNLVVARFLDGEEVAKKVDLVICHGGITTMMQATQAGMPVVALPFNFDQLYHAARCRELGLGECVTDMSLANIISCLKFDMISFQKRTQKIPPKKILEKVEQVLANKDKYKKSIAEFNKRSSRGDGADKAANLIEEFINKSNFDRL